jgi:uncharacterized protein YegL
MARRLPVYLILDVSESMIGHPLESLEGGVKLMARTLMRNPGALESLHMGVITFAAKANVSVPLTDLCCFRAPELSARPGTSLGAALRLCRESIDRDVSVSTPERKGDFKPLVFVMTDGEPTDDWRDAARELRDGRPRPTVVSVGCGGEADFDVLRELSGGEAVLVSDLSSESVQSLFSWVSTSLEATSRTPDRAGGGVDLSKVPLGKGLAIVKEADPSPLKARARLFLHMTCANTGKKYLAVYRAEGDGNSYAFAEAHKLPDDFYADGEARASVETGVALKGSPACPWCCANSFIPCHACRTYFCFRYGSETFDCSGCGKSVAVSYGGQSGGTSAVYHSLG